MRKLTTRKKFIPLLFVVSAPSGTGKSTLMNMLKKDFNDSIEQTISYTTRPPRVEEKNGVHYYFTDVVHFEQLIFEKKFLEYEKLFDEYYGTTKEEVFKIFKKNKHAFSLIDTQGALNVQKIIENTVLIFLAPPSQEEQLKRLGKRSSENEDQIQLRLEKTRKEYKESQQFTYYIINDNLKDTYEVIKSIIVAEEHKQREDYE